MISKEKINHLKYVSPDFIAALANAGMSRNVLRELAKSIPPNY